MPEKCSVVGCKSGYLNGPTSPRFRFPSTSLFELRAKWILFLNRPDYEITANSRICADHFEAQYIKVNESRTRLVPFSQDPIPTIHPLSVPKSQAVVPTQPRKPPKVRVFQLDELVPYVEKYTIKDFDDVTRFLKKSPEYQDFTFRSTEYSITAYHLVIDAGIARVKECISIDKAFHITLSFEGSPVPLPEYIDRATGSKLTHLYLLENLPNYCRNVTSNFDIQVIKELLNICYISPRGRPKYTANILKFALLLRYTSNSAYQLLKKYIPLPSQSLLRSLKSPSIDSCKALSTLRDNDLIGNDVVLLLDEMYLQPQVNFDRKTLIGCDQEFDLFKSILCFMVISLTKSIPFIVSAIPIVKISGDIVHSSIDKCISLLTKAQFNLRAIIADNHPTNVSAYKQLRHLHGIRDSDHVIYNPYDSEKTIYVQFDTVHLLKNIRNNLLAVKCFDLPEFKFSSPSISITISAGLVSWSSFHKIHEEDLRLSAHLRAAPKINYPVLHPGNKKQSVPLALAIFEETTACAFRLYLPEDNTTPNFLDLIHTWWLVVNSKEPYHPDIRGNALIFGDCKPEFLRAMNSWLTKWETSTKFGLSRQTFSSLRLTNNAIADLSSDLLSEGYKFVLTGRMQTDCLERRFSHYRQMSGGRFLVSLSEVISSESIIKMKSLLQHKLEISALTIESNQEYDENLLEEQVLKLRCINYEDLVLSEKSHQVVAYISGYISHSLLKDASCLECINLLQQDPILTQYLKDLDRGGLTLPSSSLSYYVESAFCVLEASETEIVQTTFPWKIVSLRLLQEVSQIWDSAFACILHTPQVRKTVNRIIANIYYNNLRKSINESIRKDQVAAFKSVKRQKVT